ncbi:DNA adenine methylase [Desulfoprunum benzoelyticum]|nr:DNA adenine methylase [Desulfoprunum benzoelyticum]
MYNRYIDPFLGSGAVLFYLQPKQSFLGEFNTFLPIFTKQCKRMASGK